MNGDGVCLRDSGPLASWDTSHFCTLEAIRIYDMLSARSSRSSSKVLALEKEDFYCSRSGYLGGVQVGLGSGMISSPSEPILMLKDLSR